MSGEEINQDCARLRGEIERLRQEIAVLEAQLAGLARDFSRSPKLLQTLGGYVGLGAAGKLEWPRFKLGLKQRELIRVEAQYERLEVSDHLPRPSSDSRGAPSAGRAGETARQKMERMIGESPDALVPYIRRVYRSLIEAEESPEG